MIIICLYVYIIVDDICERNKLMNILNYIFVNDSISIKYIYNFS